MRKKTWLTYMGLFVLLGAVGLGGCQKKDQAADSAVSSGGSAVAAESSVAGIENSQTAEPEEKLPSAESVLGSAATTEEEKKTDGSQSEETNTDGTDSTEAAETLLPEDMPSTFSFSSGVGGWSAGIDLQRDGSFSGSYSDSDMGDSGEKYPNGTIYLCDFTGRFADIQKTGEHTYALTLQNLQKTEQKEEIVDGVRHMPSEAYGIEGGKSFVLYTPDTPLSEVPEELEAWDPYRYMDEGEKRTTLGAYALYNEADGSGYFSYTTE